MHIVVFFQYYHNPDCPQSARQYSFVRQWAKRHQVTVITSRMWYDRRLTRKYNWAPEGVTVKMLNVPYDNRMSSKRRMLSFADYAVRAMAYGLVEKKPDVLYAVSTPLSAAWAAAKVAKARSVNWVFEVKDLWPEFPIQMGAIRRTAVKNRLRKVESNLYHDAHHIVALSPDMRQHVIGAGIDPSRVTTFVNGTDFDLVNASSTHLAAKLRAEYGLTDRKVILYAGAFGRANDIPSILECAKIMRGRDDVRFVFLGQGFEENRVLEAAASNENVVFVPAQPRHSILNWFRLADIALVTFIDLPVLGANSPSKFFDSLASSTPVIVTNPGWMKHFVENHDCGWYVPPSSPAALATQIESALADPWELARSGLNGRDIAAQQFDRETMAERIEYLLINAAGA